MKGTLRAHFKICCLSNTHLLRHPDTGRSGAYWHRWGTRSIAHIDCGYFGSVWPLGSECVHRGSWDKSKSPPHGEHIEDSVVRGTACTSKASPAPNWSHTSTDNGHRRQPDARRWLSSRRPSPTPGSDRGSPQSQEWTRRDLPSVWPGEYGVPASFPPGKTGTRRTGEFCSFPVVSWPGTRPGPTSPVQVPYR